jgi:hypothetical protein
MNGGQAREQQHHPMPHSTVIISTLLLPTASTYDLGPKIDSNSSSTVETQLSADQFNLFNQKTEIDDEGPMANWRYVEQNIF